MGPWFYVLAPAVGPKSLMWAVQNLDCQGHSIGATCTKLHNAQTTRILHLRFFSCV